MGIDGMIQGQALPRALCRLNRTTVGKPLTEERNLARTTMNRKQALLGALGIAVLAGMLVYRPVVYREWSKPVLSPRSQEDLLKEDFLGYYAPWDREPVFHGHGIPRAGNGLAADRPPGC